MALWKSKKSRDDYYKRKRKQEEIYSNKITKLSNKEIIFYALSELVEDEVLSNELHKRSHFKGGYKIEMEDEIYEED